MLLILIVSRSKKFLDDLLACDGETAGRTDRRTPSIQRLSKSPECEIGSCKLILQIHIFDYSAPQCSHCKRCISYSNSICPSVRLSVRHTPALSKRRNVARCSLHCRIAKCLPVKSCLQLTCPLLLMVSYGRCQNS